MFLILTGNIKKWGFGAKNEYVFEAMEFLFERKTKSLPRFSVYTQST